MEIKVGLLQDEALLLDLRAGSAVREGSAMRGGVHVETLVDMHCHILPGVDDGARTWEDSLAMARAAVAAGVTHLVATPHHMEGTFDNPRARVLALVGDLRDRLAEAAIALEVFPGCEAYISPDLPARVQSGEVTTLNDGGRYLLVELPYVEIPPWAEEVLFQLQVQGITPVLAHPERNRGLQGSPDILKRWIERGVVAQVDAASLGGAFGEGAKRAARRMLEARLVHVAGSDAHRAEQAAHFSALSRDAAALARGAAARDLLAGKTVPLPEPGVAAEREAGRRGLWRLFSRGVRAGAMRCVR
ncbi:MAG: CpsB/CapC family capsule biosynthesis tyrosine phosphatase [Armatimonadota bacterium]|nr:CpsB/CapC family capsule biosynthesis tyrosine phosphatase [Armatimonadota bacterium]